MAEEKNEAPKLTAMVTGANSGLGYEASRQLALSDKVGHVVLMCRRQEAAEEAIVNLAEATGKPADHFSFVLCSLTSFESVNKAVESLDKTIDLFLMNAGGMASKDLTSDGVSQTMAMNTTGHALMLEGLLKQGKLASKARCVYSGSEIASGVPGMNPTPVFEAPYVDAVTSHINATFVHDQYEKDNRLFTYGYAKAVGALYISALARENPDMYMVSVSPGGTSGTNVYKNADWWIRKIMYVAGGLMTLMGKQHSVATGAKRYVDALLQTGYEFPSGTFIASKNKNAVTGALGDQAAKAPMYALDNHELQDAAAKAIRNFF